MAGVSVEMLVFSPPFLGVPGRFLGEAFAVQRWFLFLLSACATPSASEFEARQREARQISEARAVHLPPQGDSCVGVALRISATGGSAFAERITPETVAAAAEAAGLERCRQAYQEGVAALAIPPEAVQIELGYGIGPDGKVCAVVEHQRRDPLEPAAAELFEAAAVCVKDVLFAAVLPAGKVEDRDRVVGIFRFAAQGAAP